VLFRSTPNNVSVRMPKDIELSQSKDGTWIQKKGGNPRTVMPKGGLYFDSLDYPKFPSYDPADITDEILLDIQKRSKFYRDNTDYAILLNGPWAISNSTNTDFMCALLLEKDETHDALEKWADDLIQCVKKVVDAVKGYVDIIAFSGDAGSQNAPLFSPDIYREMIVPHMRKIPQFLHENSDIKFFLHSCGSVYELIEYFIDMGVDILNPIQLSAENMEPVRLVEEFGGKMVFWGGGCDTQRVLPHGNEDEVREEVRKRVESFSKVDGFVFSQVHNIQPDVPVQNLLAMLDELKLLRK